jgi:F-type H+-transporting ATPase subunit delta
VRGGGAPRTSKKMTNRTAATRYARALLDVAVKEQSDPQAIEQQLAGFAALFDQYPALEKVLLNPAVPVQRKRATVVELTARAPLSPIVTKLLVLLAERDRLVLMPDLVRAYRARLLDHLHIVRAEVTTAVALPAERAKALEQSLARASGRTVTLATRVDPSIIGGVVARMGSTVYDGSVARQLQRMKEKLQAV